MSPPNPVDAVPILDQRRTTGEQEQGGDDDETTRILSSGSNDNDVEEPSSSSLIDQDQVVWNAQIDRIQRYAGLLAHILALLCVIVVSVWVNNASLGGGLTWRQRGAAKTNFNWHPLLMICAYMFMTVASLAFKSRGTNNNSRLWQKWTHVLSWSVAAVCATLAMMAVLYSHNDAASGLIANLYSLHSWMGVAVMGMYVAQFVVGVTSFTGVGCCCDGQPVARVSRRMMIMLLHPLTPQRKARILQVHKFVGPFIYNCTAATILLGIQEKEGFIGCSYKVDNNRPDTFPLQHFWDIPAVCRTSHGLGILVVAVTLCTNLAWYDFGIVSNRTTTSTTTATARTTMIPSAPPSDNSHHVL